MDAGADTRIPLLFMSHGKPNPTRTTTVCTTTVDGVVVFQYVGLVLFFT